MYSFLDTVQSICINDHVSLCKSDESYGDSWKKRGGVGAFMMLARKWARIENQVKQGEQFERYQEYDVFQAIEKDTNPTGIIDDIRDLRRYLLLVEAEMVRLKNVQIDYAYEKEGPDADTAVST